MCIRDRNTPTQTTIGGRVNTCSIGYQGRGFQRGGEHGCNCGHSSGGRGDCPSPNTIKWEEQRMLN